jgi:threonine/homoserine/homoserine lactone efflux protein
MSLQDKPHPEEHRTAMRLEGWATHKTAVSVMSQQLLFAFVLFAAVMFFTPGPNNIMVMSSGLTYGFRRTLPHMAGVSFGFAFMVGAVGFGLGTIFIAYPVLQTILKYLGAAYLIYLAIVIALSGPVEGSEVDGRGPMSFWGAAMFQWVNVKGWVAVIGTITAYAAIASYPFNILIQTLISLAMGVGSTVTWTLFGTALRPLLTSERAVRAFNVVMAVLLLASLYPVFMDA